MRVSLGRNGRGETTHERLSGEGWVLWEFGMGNRELWEENLGIFWTFVRVEDLT
jgi:hypothetical protein